MEIAARTEFTFREVFGPIKEVVAAGARGIADNNSWGHIFFWKACREAGFFPLLGVRFAVFEEFEATRERGDEWIAYAKGSAGLPALYRLVELSEAQFYYRPRLTYKQVAESALAVCWLGAPWEYCPDFPYYTHIHPGNTGIQRLTALAASSDNFYPAPTDEEVYRLMALRGGVLRGEPMHLLGTDRLIAEFGYEAVDQSVQIWEDFQVTELPIATNVKFDIKDPMQAIVDKCLDELHQRDFAEDEEYQDRLERELKLIEEKSFADYFLVIADMCAFAKGHMLVGPARGSSAGSLVCWLLGITEVDPIPHGLIFERFIDVNRFDFPDIDIDFPDDHRNLVFDYLSNKYGVERVARLGTIMRYKPKSALTDFSKVLSIPDWETQAVKDAIIERSGGDARLSFCLEDTLNLLDVGKELLEKYPQIGLAGRIEGHARQTGQHAAGLIICNEPITDFCGKSRNGVAQIEKKGSELLNMLKIDALGLRTLTVLQDAAEVAGIDFHDFYDLPLDDQEAFDVLNEEKYAGIFQFEGPSLQGVIRQTRVKDFNDISAATALARPGPLNSGGTAEYIERRTGQRSVTYLHPMLRSITEETYGVIIYQEQVMICTRQLGNFSWADTANIRKLMSNREGDESFMGFEEKFIEGAVANGLPKKEAQTIWNGFVTFGCLSGETLILNPHPNQHFGKFIKLKDLYNLDGYSTPKKCSEFSDRLGAGWGGILDKKQKIYMVHDDGMIRPAALINVMESGIKITYKLITESGESIRATLDHKFYQPDSNYKTLRNLKVGDSVMLMGDPPKGGLRKPFKGTGQGAHNEITGITDALKWAHDYFNCCQDCGGNYEETHHIDGDRGNNDHSNIIALCRKCHKAAHVKMDGILTIPHRKGKSTVEDKIIFIGEPYKEMTYDIEMPAPNNFIANNIVVHNSWAFNKSHAVSYGLISYWCCWMKAHYPGAFAVGCLRHVRDPEQALRLLRELSKEGLDYVAVDSERSDLNWTLGDDGVLLGGLLNVKGIGEKHARTIINCRVNDIALPPGLQKKMDDPLTPYDKLWPVTDLFRGVYEQPKEYKITGEAALCFCHDVQEDGEEHEHVVIGRLVRKSIRDLNEESSVLKRGGRILKENTMKMTFLIEDDTGMLLCSIGRYKYKKMGKPLIESVAPGEYLVVKGKILPGYSRIFFVSTWYRVSKPEDFLTLKKDQYLGAVA